MRWIAVFSLLAIALLVGGEEARAQSPGTQHYIYECSGYSYDPDSRTYTLPADCHADPNTNPATHSWLTDRIPTIMTGDGRFKQANLLNSVITKGSRGKGQTHLKSLKDGVIAADYHFQGCNVHGRRAGWAVGDHMLNPYRNFGYWSYWNFDQAWGWRGVGFLNYTPRRTGACGIHPSVRTNAARMADEFWARAERHWKNGQPGEAMFTFGIALHLVQDVAVPSHAHPEFDVRWLGKQDVFPAWATVHKASYAVSNGGRYSVTGWVNGVPVADSPGGFPYAMAAESFPYFPFNASTSPVPANWMKCDVTTDPEGCQTESGELIRKAQRYSAGYLGYFLDRMGYGG